MKQGLLFLGTLLLVLHSALAQIGGFPAATYDPSEVGQPLVMFERTRIIDANGPGTEDDVMTDGGGRQAIIAFVGNHTDGYLVTVPEAPGSTPNSHLQGRIWDLSTLTPEHLAPQEFTSVNDPQNLELITTLAGVQSHGYAKMDGSLIMGNRTLTVQPGGNIANVVQMNGPAPIPMFSRGNLFHPWFVNTYWTYGDIDQPLVLELNGVQQATWDHIGETGVIGHPFIVGNILIMASEQSRTGVATYDISDPSNPQLLDVLTLGGAGGYWPEIWGGNGALYMVFPFRQAGNGIRVVDVTDPSDLTFVTETQLPGDECNYMQFQDDYAFTGQHKVSMQTFASVLQFDTTNTSDALNPDIDTSQFALPLGQYVVTGGLTDAQGVAVFPHQAEPDTLGPSVGYHRPLAGQTNYARRMPISILIHETLDIRTINDQTLTITPEGGPAVSHNDLSIQFTFNDILQIHYNGADGWDADTTYTVTLVEDGIEDVAGNGMQGHTFSFSTGNGTPNQPPVISAFSVTTAYPAPLNSQVDFAVTANDPDAAAGDSLEYRYQFGDSPNWSAWGTDTSPDYTYTTSGHYTAKVQVREILAPGTSIGASTSSTLKVTVSDIDPSHPRARSSSPLICDEANRRLWVVNPDNNTVLLRDIDTGTQQEISVGDDPRSIDVDASGNAWVTCHDADQIDVIAPDGTVVSVSLDYGSAPFAVLMSPDRMMAYVSLYGDGTLLRFDTTTRLEVGNALPLGPTARAMATTADGSHLYVTRFISPTHHGIVWEIDTSTWTVDRTLTLERYSGMAGFFDSTAAGLGVPNYLAGVAISPDPDGAGPLSPRLLVASKLDNTNRGELTGAFNDLDHDNTVRAVVTRLDLASGNFLDALDIDNSDSPTALQFSPLGDYLFVALQGNNDLVVYDNLRLESDSGLGAFVTRLEAALAPQGLAYDAVTQQLFVKNFMSRTVSGLDISGFLATGSLNTPSTSIPTVTTESLPSEVLLGKQVFYNAGDLRMSAEGYLSCATCHVDGGSDGRVWDFTGRGEGLRNTSSLRGRAGMAHGNVHWSGNFDEIQDFEHDIRNAFGGEGFLSDADFTSTQDPLGPAKAGLSPELDALADYLTSLDHTSLERSPHREPDGSLSVAALQGQLLFEGMNCASCHGGTNLTSSSNPAALVDVGTLRTTSGRRLGQLLPGIDTPTLRGLWANAPYFHDGSAASLNDVFAVTGGDVYPVESATSNNGATFPGWRWDFSNRGTGWVTIQNGQSIVFSNIDGGIGGPGAVDIRFSSGSDRQAQIRINGGDLLDIVLPNQDNPVSAIQSVNWGHARREAGVTLLPGTTNTIEIINSGAIEIVLDEIMVSTAEELDSAAPHRQVLALSAQEQTDLIAFLNQLDGQAYTPLLPTEPLVHVAPTVNQDQPSYDETVYFDVHFDRLIEGFDSSDLILSGTAGPASGVVTEISAGHYRVSVSGHTVTGTVQLALVAGAATSVADAAPSLAATPASLDYLSPYLESDDLAALSDEFDSDTLADWSRNYAAEGWGAGSDKLETWDINQTTPGHMHLMPHSTLNYFRHVGPVVFKPITGDFVATVQVDISRRDGLPGPPPGSFSLCGMVLRNQQDYTNGVAVDWPQQERYLSFVVGKADAGPASSQWQLTINETNNLSEVEHLNVNTGVMTLQVIRIGDAFVFLRREDGGQWIVQERFVRPDLNDTLQVGLVASVDFDSIFNPANGLYNGNAEIFMHNTTTTSAANGFNVDPDLIADIDYYRFHRPSVILSESILSSLAVTGNGPTQWLADSSFASFLGDAAGFPQRSLKLNASSIDPTTSQSVDFDLQITPGASADMEYRWDFGDGTLTEWSTASMNVSHSFEDPGNYTVTAYTRLGQVYLGSATQAITATPAFVDSDDDDLEDSWELEHFGDLLGGPQDDSDGDGWLDLAEFAFGSAPMQANDKPEFNYSMVIDDGIQCFEVSYRQLRTPGPINYAIVFSTDLSVWDPDPSLITSTESSVIDDRYEQVTIRDSRPQSMDRIFRIIRAFVENE